MAYIGKTPVIGNFQVCDAISVVNNQAAYTMQVAGVNVSPETAQNCLVSLNGILQAPTTSYTVSGSTITFASNLVTGDVIDFIQILGNVLDLGVPSDNTVSLAKLTATGTKDATTFLRGDNTFAAAGGGKVLQVITATDSTERTTSSASFVSASTTLSVSITPSNSSNKIYVMANFTGKTGDTGRIFYTIFRDSTNIGSSNGLSILENFSGGVMAVPVNLALLDSPSTTSSTTYEVRMRVENASSTINYTTPLGSITVMEIGA